MSTLIPEPDGLAIDGRDPTVIRSFLRFLTSLFVAIIFWLIGVAVYRLYFHPLARYPGPWYMKISGWYDFFIAYGEHRHLHFQYLHQKYGPVVRYGPNELAYNTPSAFQAIYGFKANVQKGHAVTVGVTSDPDSRSTFSETDKQRAMKKRRVLSQGFSESALSSAESFMISQIETLCKQLANTSTEKVKDLSLWLNYLAYDIMGEVVFGRSFDMLTDPSLRYVLSLIDASVFCTLLARVMPLLYKTGLIAFFVPKVLTMRKQFIKYVNSTVEQRLQQVPASDKEDRKDFFYYLLNTRDSETGKPLSRTALLTEGLLLVTGGSDTTSTGMAATIFYLLKYPRCLERLYEELSRTFDHVDEIRTGRKLKTCLYLRACVQEALRMAPPGPGILPRIVLEGGQLIDGAVIPAGTQVGGAFWALAYNADTYPEPEVFRPERYLMEDGRTEEEVDKSKGGYWAFSTGPRKCPGMKMAYQELYLTVARLVYLFEMTPEKPEELEENFKLLDHFNVKKKGPFVSFNLREGQTV
ncbi:uncharacterized protein A1O5_06336 [Cladophialophora psammophila CBS 110553]|uniref:Cytochrome P450 oxidoreductase n=1 Tax=Cladophialophora psammophila CBS 110553 TaxID=1182543 RepID=W9WQR9_9EURO|nr:uncharacterized protein A1O5_06336 [Cladophialophora psammophila CBS 110553]EXJ70268.1 hypothetical protein A1O5_06336 [Cladophialophora psammophila CBS 110553]